MSGDHIFISFLELYIYLNASLLMFSISFKNRIFHIDLYFILNWITCFTIFPAVKYRFYQLNKSDIVSHCYCDITACACIAMHSLKFDRICLKTKENVLSRKFNGFDVEYEIYFTRETGFTRASHS